MKILGLGECFGYCSNNFICERRLATECLKVKDHRRLLNFLATVMFPGTPCTFLNILCHAYFIKCVEFFNPEKATNRILDELPNKIK